MSSTLEQIVSGAKSFLSWVGRVMTGGDLENLAVARERERVAIEDLAIAKEPWKAPSHVEVDRKQIPLDTAWKLCLATYCGINPAYIAKHWGQHSFDEPTQRKIKDAYYRAVPGNPTIERYGKETPARNRVHYYLSSVGIDVPNQLASAQKDQTPLAWTISHHWFGKYISDLQRKMGEVPAKYERLLNAMGLRVYDVTLTISSLESIRPMYRRALIDSYRKGDQNPWATASEEGEAVLLARAFFARLKKLDILFNALEDDEKSLLDAIYFKGEKPYCYSAASDLHIEVLRQQGLQKLKYAMYTSGLLRKDACIEELPKELRISRQEGIIKKCLEQEVEESIKQIQEDTKIKEYRNAARKASPLTSLYIDLLGDSNGLIRAAYQGVLLAWEVDPFDVIMNYEEIKRQTKQAITYRLEKGWFVLTPTKQRLLQDSIAALRGYIYRDVLELRYGLRDGRNYSPAEIATLLDKSPETITNILREARNTLESRLGFALTLLRQGATDDDIRTYREAITLFY